MQRSLRLLLIGCAILGLVSQQAIAQDRISKSRLREEQRIITAHNREARKDLDRAKVDLNGNRMRTAEIILNRTEVSLSKAGGLLDEHPVRIEKLRGLFITDRDRQKLRESFEKIDAVYLDIEREYYSMIDEIGGSTFRRARIELLKHIESFLPDLEEADPALAAEFTQLLAEYERAVEAGDEAGARAAFEKLVDLIDANKSTLDSIGASIGDTSKYREVTEINIDSMIQKLSPAYQAEVANLKGMIGSISDPLKQEEANQLLNDYVQALLAGDTAAAAKAKAKLEALLADAPPPAPAPAPTPAPTTAVPAPQLPAPTVPEPAPQPAAPFKTTPEGIQVLDPTTGKALYNGQTFREGENRLPQVEYTGGTGKRITKEYDVVVVIDSAAGKFDAYQENDKIWSLDIKEDPSQRRVDATLITVWELIDGTSAASGVTISGWKAVAPDGSTIRESSEKTFTVEFSSAGNYKILVFGTTAKGNPFEIGREYQVDDGLFF